MQFIRTVRYTSMTMVDKLISRARKRRATRHQEEKTLRGTPPSSKWWVAGRSVRRR